MRLNSACLPRLTRTCAARSRLRADAQGPAVLPSQGPMAQAPIAEDDHDHDHEEDEDEEVEEEGKGSFEVPELTLTCAVSGQVVMPRGSLAPAPRW